MIISQPDLLMNLTLQNIRVSEFDLIILYEEAIQDFNLFVVKKKLLSFQDKIELRKYVYDTCAVNEDRGKEMLFDTLEDLRKCEGLFELLDHLEKREYDALRKSIKPFDKKYEILNEMLLLSQSGFGLQRLLEKGPEKLKNFVNLCCLPSKPVHNQMVIKTFEFMRKRGHLRAILSSLSLENLNKLKQLPIMNSYLKLRAEFDYEISLIYLICEKNETF